jgi:hypothetical protein
MVDAGGIEQLPISNTDITASKVAWDLRDDGKKKKKKGIRQSKKLTEVCPLELAPPFRTPATTSCISVSLQRLMFCRSDLP